MAPTSNNPRPEIAETAIKIIPPPATQTSGLRASDLLDDNVEKRFDEIEMIGEEEAVGWKLPLKSDVSPGMRYLHCSRTINQLVIDRNRAVGLYLGVASLLWTASSAILNARPENLVHLRVPIQTIQYCCLPATFGVLTVLALFVGLLLIRTRVGLIYEVAKMNVLLGIPVGRVRRLNPWSIFFIMYAMISLAGGCSGMLFIYHVTAHPRGVDNSGILAMSYAAGISITVALIALYVGTVMYTTSDKKLRDVKS